MMSTSRHAPVVLLVQQRNDDLDMYAEFLTLKGLRVVAVSSPAEALRAAPSADIVVTAIVLDREMSGIELVARLRADSHTKHTPIIVLTASAWRAERDRACEVGCNLFLQKPCLPEDLLRHVRLLLASEKQGAKPRTTKADRSNKSDRRDRKQGA
jgi:two-component system cell cycle response regulator DivK